MSFSERMRFKPIRNIQIDDIDISLHNRLINVFQEEVDDDIAKHVLDRFGKIVNTDDYFERLNKDNLIEFLESCEWYQLYDAIEYVVQYYVGSCCICDKNCSIHISSLDESICSDQELLFQFKTVINTVLEQEKSGYRLINGEISKITDNIEISEIVSATNSEFESVNMHLNKALALYSDRVNPDYNNSVKESISAVEAMCCIIIGNSGKPTLGNALKKLEEKGVHIHPSQKIAFEKLYGYASNEAGIRHGNIDFVNVPAEDAKFMLIACSAFINYLKEKII